MGRIGSLAYETFTVEVSGTFMKELDLEVIRDVAGDPQSELNVADDGWSTTPEWVNYREEVNGEFVWQTSSSEDTVADKETMIRTAQLRVRKYEVDGIKSHMRIKRICDGRYYNITHYHDDPGPGHYMMIYLKVIDDNE